MTGARTTPPEPADIVKLELTRDELREIAVALTERKRKHEQRAALSGGWHRDGLLSAASSLEILADKINEYRDA